MIYLFTGSDTNKVRAKAFQWVEAVRAKAPDAVYIRLNSDSISESAIRDALSSQGLFFSKSLILLDDPFLLSESGETVFGLLNELAKSDNPVAILAPKLLAARVKKIEAKAEKVFKIDVTEKAARGFNSGLVNALAAKDGAGLWKELQKAYRQGDVPELVHGLLHWKARDMMQKGSPKWGKEGARKLSRDLIVLVSDSRSGDLGLGEGLERFVLGIK
jgi:hypothetical protein